MPDKSFPHFFLFAVMQMNGAGKRSLLSGGFNPQHLTMATYSLEKYSLFKKLN